MRSPHAWIAAFLLWFHVLPSFRSAVSDPDVWWLMRMGQDILGGSFPRTNDYSWSAPDHPWTSHEPLLGVLYGLAGPESIGLLRNLVLAATMVLIAHLAWRPASGWAVSLTALWATQMVAWGRSERPMIFGNLFLLLVTLLTRGSPGRRRLVLACLLVWVWASCHGSFVIGVLVVFLARPAWGVLAGALTLVQPSGGELYGLLASHGSDRAAVSTIQHHLVEWFPLLPGDGACRIGFAGLVLAGALILRSRRIDALALWSAVSLLALKHRRFLDLVGLALVPRVSEELERLTPERPTGHPIWLLGPLLGLGLVGAGRPSYDRVMYPETLPVRIPADARLYHDHHLGGWLAFHRIPVFWDGRDGYPAAVYDDGLRIVFRREGWAQTFERRRFDAVLTRDAELVAHLTGRGWRVEARGGELTLVLAGRRERRTAVDSHRCLSYNPPPGGPIAQQVRAADS